MTAPYGRDPMDPTEAQWEEILDSQKYGTHTEEIEAIIEVVKGMSEDEFDRLALYHDTSQETIKAQVNAFLLVRDLSFFAGVEKVYKEAVTSVPVTIRPFNPLAIPHWGSELCVWRVFLAILARDYIGTEFTQEQHDILMKPWNEFMEGRKKGI